MSDKTLRVAPPFYKQWMLAGNPAYFFDRLARDMGDFVYCRGALPFYFVNHPDLVRTVLKDTNSRFDKNSPLYAQFRKGFGTGLKISEGELWKRQRRLMQPYFSPSAVRGSFDIMTECVDRTLQRWHDYAKRDATFNLVGEMYDLTLDIAGSTLLGGNFAGAQKDIARWTHNINAYSATLPLPVVSELWFPRPANVSLKRTLREFYAFINEILEERKDGGARKGLLHALLEAKDPETGECMSREQLCSDILGLIIGGHDTSSTALTWTFCQLAQHPEVEKKLHAELDEVLQGEMPSLSHLPRLKYTKMVLDEAMRLNPPVWFENRNATEDLELWGVTIPKGTMVAFSRYSLHRHPEFWPEPERFIPERFAEETTKFAYVPFGGGPRICIGINLAVMELVLSLATLAQRYRVELRQPRPVQMRALLLMQPKGDRVAVGLIPRDGAHKHLSRAVEPALRGTV